MKTLFRFLTDTSAATAVEYGLLAALISIGMLVGLGGLSDGLQAVFDKLSTTINGAPK